MTDKLDFIYDSEIFVDLYSILNIDMEATNDNIKNAYINLVKLHHPDHGGNCEMYQEITKAYEILYNKDSRKEYDLYYLKKSMDEFKGDDILRLKSEYKNFVDANIRPISKEKLDELYEDIFKDREKFLEDKIEENELERRINDIDLERKNDNIESIDDRLLKMMNELNKNLEKPITISEFFEYFKNNLSTNKSSELIVNELGTLDTLPGYGTNYSLFGSDSNFVGSNLYSDINEDSFNLSEVEVNKEEFVSWRSTRKVDTKLSQLEIENSLEKRKKEEQDIFNEVECHLTSSSKKKEVQKYLKNKHLSEDINEYNSKLNETKIEDSNLDESVIVKESKNFNVRKRELK